MKENILKYLGFFTKQRAINEGFNKNAKYYFIPCFLKIDNDDIVMVEKHWIFIPCTFFFSMLEYFYNMILDEDFDDEGFMFKIIGDI